MPETGDLQPQAQMPAGTALQAKLDQGMVLHRQGKLADAERCYGEVLQLQPDHFAALRLLGVIALQTRQTERGVELIQKAIVLNPNVAEAHNNLGIALKDLKRLVEALASYDKAIALKPDYTEAHYNRGNALMDLKRLGEALASYDKAIALKPDFAVAHNNRGNVLMDLKRPAEALASYDKVIGLTSDITEVHSNRGNALMGLKRPAEALASYDKAIAFKPDYAEALGNRGNALMDLNRPAEALASYERAIALKPDYAEAHNNRGNALMDLKRPAEALASYDRAIALKPDYANAHNSRGNALMDLKRVAEALASYDRAIALKPDYAAAHNNRGNALMLLNRPEQALVSYDKVIGLKPDYAEAHGNRGNALRDLKRPAEALASYDRAIALKPDVAEVHNNRGNALMDLRRPEEALAGYDKAIALKPDIAEVHDSRGNALMDLRRPEQALASYERAIALKPDIKFLYGSLIHVKMRVCDWSNLESQIAQLIQKINRSEKVSRPFPFLTLTNSPELQRKAAEIYALGKYPLNIALPKIAKRQSKVRVAYVSSDFGPHPVSNSIVGFIEALDRDRFDAIGISLGPEDPSEIGQRIKRAFNKFIDVSRMSDQAVVRLMRELEVDIAVDLMGYTKGSRTNIFVQRAAPVQVSHIGFSGTMGAQYIDYIIADRVVIPIEHASFFSEKIVLMPDTYLPTDRKLAIAQKTPTRIEVGLPNNAYVFCCFNNSYKITPDVFDCWMRILKRVENSVIWLFEGNTKATSNLRKEAEIRGVHPERLVFAKRTSLPDHLARHRLADLFLDTLPYNAHTTASDALWAGLPVLTCIGKTFAGRVAASLLNAIGLPELIATTLEAYEKMVIDLATHPEKLAAIKLKLAENRLTTPLFDTKLFTKHIEAAYSAMYQRYQAGLPPNHIVIPN